MATITPVDAALSVGQRIGRYFALVSMIPSLFLVLWMYFLIAAGAISGKPSLHNVRVHLGSQWSVSTILGLVLATFGVAMILHPLQFATTRLLEGYWGTTPLSVAAMKIRIVHHRKRLRQLRRKAGYNKRELSKARLKAHPEWEDYSEEELADSVSKFMKSERGDPLMLHLIAEQEARERAGRYPNDDTRILPTQLGNALRSFEDSAGSQYGLDAITVIPRLHLIAPDRHLDYMKDAREDMDSAVRTCTVGFLAAILTVALLLTDGIWLLWALLPYSVSFLAYRGAVSAAENYGAVIASVIDLDRFLLYESLGLYKPRDSAEEKEVNAKLMQVLAGGTALLPYRPKDGAAERSASVTWRPRKPQK